MRQSLSHDDLRKVRAIERKADFLANEEVAGRYQTVFKETEIDLAPLPLGATAEDIVERTLQAADPHALRPGGEAALQLLLAVDLNASFDLMPVGRTRREWMAEIAGVLAFSALRSDDEVGLVLFTDRVELYVPPARGREHVARLLSEILVLEPSGRKTDLTHALDFAGQVLDRRSVVFVLSDFTMVDDFYGEMDRLGPTLTELNVRHDVVALSVNDSREFLMPDVGLWSQPEPDRMNAIQTDTSNAWIRKSYTDEIERRQLKLGLVARSAGVDLLDLVGEQPYLPTLLTFFTRRLNRIAES